MLLRSKKTYEFLDSSGSQSQQSAQVNLDPPPSRSTFPQLLVARTNLLTLPPELLQTIIRFLRTPGRYPDIFSTYNLMRTSRNLRSAVLDLYQVAARSGWVSTWPKRRESAFYEHLRAEVSWRIRYENGSKDHHDFDLIRERRLWHKIERFNNFDAQQTLMPRQSWMHHVELEERYTDSASDAMVSSSPSVLVG